MSWREKIGKWMARINCDGKEYYLGVFSDEVEAARVYNAEAERLFGEFALLNEIGVV